MRTDEEFKAELWRRCEENAIKRKAERRHALYVTAVALPICLIVFFCANVLPALAPAGSALPEGTTGTVTEVVTDVVTGKVTAPGTEDAVGVGITAVTGTVQTGGSAYGAAVSAELFVGDASHTITDEADELRERLDELVDGAVGADVIQSAEREAGIVFRTENGDRLNVALCGGIVTVDGVCYMPASEAYAEFVSYLRVLAGVE